mgnify:FL=1
MINIMKRRKKKWTTKNTHFKKDKKREEEPDDWMLKVASWIFLALAILIITIIALNNHVVGYDNFIGRPLEWSRSLFD